MNNKWNGGLTNKQTNKSGMEEQTALSTGRKEGREGEREGGNISQPNQTNTLNLCRQK